MPLLQSILSLYVFDFLTAPTCYCSLNLEQPKNAITTKSPELLPSERDDLTLKVLAYRRRSGTLPPCTNHINNGENDDEVGVIPVNFPNKLNSANRLSVSWLDTHMNCNNEQENISAVANPVCDPTSGSSCNDDVDGLFNNISKTTNVIDNDNTRGECQTEMSQSTEGTMILFSPVDPLGYAQLIHTQTDEQFTSPQNIYSKFPTSFV
ncbi:unnamed protein product [Trichobilharzia regenti]|nr:unnamed protein product [Trichobilharzia regenti]